MTEPLTASLSWNGRTGSLELDGHDISRAVHRATLTLEAGDWPELELDVNVQTVTVGHVDHPQVKLHMPDEARDLLIARGWTPPPGDGDD